MTGEEIAQQRIVECIRDKRSTLNLDGLGLTKLELPTDKIRNITRLFVNYNNLTELPDNLADLNNLYSFSAHSNELECLPESFFYLTNLAEITLNNNRINHLSENFGKLAYLREVKISDNKLDDLPDSLIQLKLLKELYVERNLLTRVKASILSLDSLIRLNLSGNLIEKLPDLDSDSTIDSLYLQGNRISEIPQSFERLTKLTYLNLRENRITFLPDSFCELRSLGLLLLDDNSLECLPERIGDLGQLDTLALSGNYLKKLPKSLSNLTKLTTLYASFNKMEELFDSFENMTGLTEFVVSNNQISKLPTGFSSLKGLRVLDIQNNKIDEYPAELRDLDAPFLMVDYRGNPFVEKALERSQRYTKIWDNVPRHLRELLKTYFSSFTIFYFEKTRKQIEFNVLNDSEGLIFDLVPNEDTNPDEVETYLEEYFGILREKLGEGAKDGFIYPSPTDDQANFYAQTQAIGLSYGILRVKDTIQAYIQDKDAYQSVSQMLDLLGSQVKNIVRHGHELHLENQRHTVDKARLEGASWAQEKELHHRRIEAQSRAITPTQILVQQQVTINNQVGDAFDKLIGKAHPYLDEKLKGDAKDLQKEIDELTEKTKPTQEEKKTLGKRLKRFVDGMQETLKTTKGFGEAAKDMGEQLGKLKDFAGTVLQDPNVAEAIDTFKRLLDNPPSI